MDNNMRNIPDFCCGPDSGMESNMSCCGPDSGMGSNVSCCDIDCDCGPVPFGEEVMNIKILGPGCKKCDTLYENTKLALVLHGKQANVEKITDVSVITQYGVESTPGLVINEKVVSEGKVLMPYEIIKILDSSKEGVKKSALSEKEKELVAIGASIGGNCVLCLEWHYKRCIELGYTKEEMREAFDMAKKVKEAPNKKIYETADRLIKR